MLVFLLFAGTIFHVDVLDETTQSFFPQFGPGQQEGTEIQ